MTPNAFLKVGVVVGDVVGRMSQFSAVFTQFLVALSRTKEGVVEENYEMFLIAYNSCVLIHIIVTLYCSWIPET
jgi:hypothetical protein